jgi:uncharacterized damage-inducible protein DinB
MTSEQIFVKYSVEKLTQLSGRVVVCLDKLTPEQVWTRNSENENAIGNLVLHLCGNLGQWIGYGVAGKPDTRVRDLEFSARGDVGVTELKERLVATVRDTVGILEDLPVQRLGERTRVQAYELTVLEAIYHVVEHFSGHTGQILFATKLWTGVDLGFYRHLNKPTHSAQVP